MFDDNRTRKTKHVLITGGSRGIGAEAVRRFTSRGASTAFLYRRSYREALELSRETGALNIRCNVADPESVHAAMEVVNEFFDGEIDVLVCNAGIADFNLITDIGVQRWREMIDTNLNSAYYCIHEVLPGMISRKKGSIILVSSMWGQVGASCEVAYSTAKAGLIGLTKALAKEVGPSGIRVNCIAPGLIATDMNRDVDEDSLQGIIEETPLCRIGTPADIAAVMDFLASDQSAFVTGQVIGVNGGLIV
ncbi:MAG: 3-oxoacyl-ACP reductase FabG [Mogibacterium sp.]|nr:3-oxoacyl-ACP reductase FabG [Mogibacterium sp.]